jgi:hypothetical protein
MSTITWVTPKGSLGVVPETEYYELQLVATDSDEQNLVYSSISGELPGGVYVTRDGKLRGVPTITSQSGKTVVFSFTIRATNPQGKVADRTFSLTVSNTAGPKIIASTDLIGAWFDGTYVDYQFTSINENPIAVDTWKVISGDLPPGTTLSSDGKLTGYIGIIAVNTTELGYDVAPNDEIVYDPKTKSTDKYFNFTVQATDGFRFATLNVRMLVVSKGNYTADNTVTSVNNTFIRIDADNKYRPIILNDPNNLPTLVAGSTFMYKFLAYDPEDEPVSWTITQLAFSGMDQLDAPVTQVINGNGTVGPYTLVQTQNLPYKVVVYYNGVFLPESEYTIVSTSFTFNSLTPAALDSFEVQFISSTSGYDSILFDQGASGLPAGLSINRETGWIYGVLPTQEPDIVTYEFKLNAYRTMYPSYISDSVTFNLNVKRTINEEIIWDTDEFLGYIDNGSVSELSVSAHNTLKKPLEYSIIYNPYRKLPQGLKFLPSGIFTGRTTFRYFSLDGTTGWLTLESTENLAVGMQVQGPGVASGCKITDIVDQYTIEIQPAIYVRQGTKLSFSNQTTTEVVATTSNAKTTSIDGGTTTFDQVCSFTVKAEAIDKSISSTKTFSVKVNPYNLSPYENIYLRALPSEDQRTQINAILNDKYIFPPNLIYRPDDPLFGVSKVIKFLFLPGLSPSVASSLVSAIDLNHYNKAINFGTVKTAVAKDDYGNVIYEVVYVEAEDLEAFDTLGPPLEVALDISNSFLYGSNSYNKIYPNSFLNMQKRIESAIGYTNRGALPKWMTSVQENGLVLGLTRGIILAYVKPNSSKLIQYRLNNSELLSTSNFSFVADRYQWDNSLSQYYDIATNTFLKNKQTTFDKYTTAQTRNELILTEITSSSSSNVIEVPDGVNCGVGWVVSAQDIFSIIPTNTVITKVDGRLLTLSNDVTASTNARIKIDGTTFADYAVSTAFNYIDGRTLSFVKKYKLMDGVINFATNEKLIFVNQQGFSSDPYDGWTKNDEVIPGYLEKIAGTSDVNQRGGLWKINTIPLPEVPFDSDFYGFDESTPDLQYSYFDQSDDFEISLEFVNEVLINQAVKVRTGKTYPNSILVYQTAAGEAVPHYISINTTVRTAETTFDGGTCCVREKDLQALIGPKQARRGGTNFGSNIDKYIVPESLDKYIKFPQNGVFV